MTQTDWLDHKQLQIVKGVAATPGDPYTAENPLQVVNLMGGPITLDEWSPNIPALKNGGVWASSPVADGRTLLAAPVGNVTERMSILISDSSYAGVQRQLTALNQMAADCRDFWQADYQIDPVYLVWFASCGTGPQYAIIYNIELAPEYQPAPIPTLRVNVTIERESAWRWIPPGANPKLWAYEVNLSNPQFNYNVASLVSFTNDLINTSVQNKHEWLAAAYGLQVTPLSKNYMEISAAQVPGDAPALVQLAIRGASTPFASVYVARSSKDYSGVDHTGVQRANALTLNAGDGNTASVVTKTLGAAATGLISNGSSVNYYYGQRTATGIDANYVTACGWGGATGANGIKLDRQFFRGTFAVFCRATNNSAAGVLTDMKMRVFIEEFEDNATQYSNSITLPEVYVPLTGTGNPGNQLSYMGTVTIPFSDRAVVSPLGYGIQLQESNSNIRISLQLKYEVATANRIFRMLDLIFIPIDEGMLQIVTPQNLTGGTPTLLIDNTGYLNRGDSEQTAKVYTTNANSGGIGIEVRGQHIMLKPGTAQRLYFLLTEYVTIAESQQTDVATIGLNIVPRSYGIREQ